MDLFLLLCLITTAPETQEQRDFANLCNRTYSQSACLSHANNIKRAFDSAENTRSEGVIAGCVRRSAPQE
jgi:hypothetical protein